MFERLDPICVTNGLSALESSLELILGTGLKCSHPAGDFNTLGLHK